VADVDYLNRKSQALLGESNAEKAAVNQLPASGIIPVRTP
jgi:hypothetical protein